jgi:hypothetical protein
MFVCYVLIIYFYTLNSPKIVVNGMLISLHFVLTDLKKIGFTFKLYLNINNILLFEINPVFGGMCVSEIHV